MILFNIAPNMRSIVSENLFIIGSGGIIIASSKSLVVIASNTAPDALFF